MLISYSPSCPLFVLVSKTDTPPSTNTWQYMHPVDSYKLSNNFNQASKFQAIHPAQLATSMQYNFICRQENSFSSYSASIFYSCNAGTSDCALGLWSYISGKLQVPMLQLLCYTSVEVNGLNANMGVSTGFLIYAYLKSQIMVMQQVTLQLRFCNKQMSPVDIAESPVGQFRGS